MELKLEEWDDIIAGVTGNLSSEVHLIDKAKEKIKAGNEVFLTDNDGNRIYKLGYDFGTEEFIKIFINF